MAVILIAGTTPLGLGSQSGSRLESLVATVGDGPVGQLVSTLISDLAGTQEFHSNVGITLTIGSISNPTNRSASNRRPKPADTNNLGLWSAGE